MVSVLLQNNSLTQNKGEYNYLSMDRVRTFGMRYLLGLLICVATSRNGSVRDVIDGQEYLIVEEVEETTLWAKI